MDTMTVLFRSINTLYRVLFEVALATSSEGGCGVMITFFSTSGVGGGDSFVKLNLDSFVGLDFLEETESLIDNFLMEEVNRLERFFVVKKLGTGWDDDSAVISFSG